LHPRRWLARALFLAIGILVVLAALPHKTLKVPGERSWGQTAATTTDASLYQKIVSEMQAGQDYYNVAATEHRLRGYPTTPAQVFRLPTLAWGLTLLHYEVLRIGALFALLGAIVVLFFKELVAAGLSLPVRVTCIGVATTGFSVAGVVQGAYWHEVWAALLIAASLLLYRRSLWWPSVALGLLACLIRELAIPYLLVMAAFAIYEKQWKQLAAWASAVVSFAVLFSIHMGFASGLYRSGDIVSSSWLSFGGWDFAIATAKWNILLHALPNSVVALAICLGVIGLAGARDDRARRAAAIVAGYITGFLIVGRPENYYWGVLYAPLLPMGFLFLPTVLPAVLRAASFGTRL
jgi:hypothetical protein